MIDQQLARLRTHRSNIQRYRNLLQTSLTELERKFVEQRLTEEQSSLESLTNSPSQSLSRVKRGALRATLCSLTNRRCVRIAVDEVMPSWNKAL